MEQNAQYTPGEWRASEWKYTNPDRTIVTIETDKDAIAQMCNLWRPKDKETHGDAELWTNARLIARAPALHHALGLAAAALATIANVTTDPDIRTFAKDTFDEARAAMKLEV